MTEQLLQTADGSFLNTRNLCLRIATKGRSKDRNNLFCYYPRSSGLGELGKFDSVEQARAVGLAIAKAITSEQPLILWDDILKAAGIQR